MEDSFSKISGSQQRENEETSPPANPVPDDLTNLNWVAGIPVPMNTSVSPPEGSRARKLLFASSSASTRNGTETNSPTTPTVVPVRTKVLKTPLPTYKIVVKDQTMLTQDPLSHTHPSSIPSPERRDSVILANVVSSSEAFQEKIDVEMEKLITDASIDEDIIDITCMKEEEVKVVEASTCTEEDNINAYSGKPNCSYTCLIGMALKASNGCLPVNAIYQYIEKEFPYFITAPDGWKNSVRHNLSLNPIFRKVNREGWTGKKGYLWEVCPDKQELVDKEILRFLHSTGKKLGKFTAPMKTSCSKYKQQRSKKLSHPPQLSKSAAPIFCNRCTRIISPTPQDSSTSSDDSSIQLATAEDIKKFSAEIQGEIASSEVEVKSKSIVCQPAFDTEKIPSKYMGIKSPPGDPKEAAQELFGLCSNPEDINNSFYPPLSYGGPFFPLYAQPNQFGMAPYENFEQVVSNSSSSSSNSSPMNPMTAMLSHYPQYAMPVPFHYILGGQYPQMYCSCAPNAGDIHCDGTAQKSINSAPVSSVKVLSSSEFVENAGVSNNVILGESLQNGVGRKSDITRKGKHQNRNSDLYTYPDVASLSSPLKRMKVMDDRGMLAADESISAYFADVSANSTCSDDDTDENEEVSNIMSLLLKSNQHQRKEAHLPLAGLDHISTQEKESLEKITGTSDLGALLSNGLESIAARGTQKQDSVPKSLTSDINKHVLKDKFSFGEECATMEMCDIDSKVSSAQVESYYLPSLDSLLSIGEDTIVTIKAAMNLDIQGVVEVATEESCEVLESRSNVTLKSINSDGIQIN